MGKGASRSQGSGGEFLQHFGSIRLRVVGSGTLKGTLYSLDQIKSRIVPDLTLQTTTDREPTKLTNFITQRAVYKLNTTEINEWFRVSRILIFVKDYATSYPQ